jgi:hypothetical protein
VVKNGENPVKNNCPTACQYCNLSITIRKAGNAENPEKSRRKLIREIMKRLTTLTLTLSLLFFTGNVFAQYVTDFQVVYPFNKGQNQTINYTFTKDNAGISPSVPGYMVMASSLIGPSVISLSALKLNPDFTISFSRSYIPPSSVNSYSIISQDVIATSEGGYAVCGRVTYDGVVSAFMAVFDSNAFPLWYKEYKGISILNAIVEVPQPFSDKVKYIACGTVNNSAGYSIGVILGVDFELIPVWQNNTALQSRVDRFVYNDLINFKNPDADVPFFALAGNAVTQPYYDKDVLLTVIDYKGNTYYSYLYGLKNDGNVTFDEEGYGLALSPKDQIVITGRTKCSYPYVPAVKWDDVLLFAVDFKGNMQWMLRYDIPKNASSGEYAQKVLVNDEYLYVSGFYRSYVFTPNASYDAFMFETYLDGKPNYVRVYGDAGLDVFFAQEVNFKKDGIISAGFSNSFIMNPAGAMAYTPYIVEAYRTIKDTCKSRIFKLPYYGTELKQDKIDNYLTETPYEKKELIEIRNPIDLKILCPKIPLISPLAESSGLKSAKEEMAQAKTAGVSVSPNPVQFELNISGAEGNSSFKIYSVNGKLVKRGILNNTSLNVADLPKGMYFISVKNSHKSATVKFLKE